MNKARCIGLALLMFGICIYSGYSKMLIVDKVGVLKYVGNQAIKINAINNASNINNINNTSNGKSASNKEQVEEPRASEVTPSRLFELVEVARFDPTYKEVVAINKNLYFVTTSNSKRGIVNNKAEWLVKPLYEGLFGVDSLGVYRYKEGELIPAKKNGKWGYINLKEEVVIDFLYDEAEIFSEGLAAVKQGGKGGYINEAGEVVIPLKYSQLTNFDAGIAEVDGGALDRTGKEIVPCYQGYIGLCNIRWLGDGVLLVRDEMGEISYVNREGKVIAEKEGSIHPIGYNADEEAPSINGKIKVYADKAGNTYNSCQTYIDFSGEELYPRKYSQVNYQEQANLVIVANEEKGSLKYGMTDFSKEAHEIIPLVYDYLGNASEGYIVAKKNNKYGYLDYKGREILPFIYDNAEDFMKGSAIVSKGEYSGLINKQGQELLPCKYSRILRSYDFDDILYILEGEKEGVVDSSGKLLIPPINKDFYVVSDGIIEVREEDDYTYLDYEGNCIILPTYASIRYIEDGYYLAQEEDNYVLLRIIPRL